MSKVMFVAIALFSATLVASGVNAQDGLEGTVVRPDLVAAKVDGCSVAKPGMYEVNVGDLIEIDYTYPVIDVAIPTKVSFKKTGRDAVIKSPIGFRNVSTPVVIGVGAIAFYFDAKKEGTETITIIIDDVEYAYEFKVARM